MDAGVALYAGGMFTEIQIRNFQSLQKVDLALGKLTLVTGESHSGKSAFMRALQAIASNVRGTSTISQGAEDMSITLVSDTHKVTLHRNAKGRDDYYRIVDLLSGTEQEFRTLGAGGVPEEVTEALRIDPVRKNEPSINYHVQFDRPYLLEDTPATVARTLGELTNVNTIFEAVREGNRRRGNLNTELKSKVKDLDAAYGLAKEFADLPAKDSAIRRAEESLNRARSIQERVEILEHSLAAVRIADQLLARAVPDLAGLSERVRNLEYVEQQLRIIALADETSKTAATDLDGLYRRDGELHTKLHEALVAMGTCPTCGSTVS